MRVHARSASAAAPQTPEPLAPCFRALRGLCCTSPLLLRLGLHSHCALSSHSRRRRSISHCLCSGAIRSAMAAQVGATLNAQTLRLGSFQGLRVTSGRVQLNPSQVLFSSSSRRCVAVRAATAVAPKFTTMKPLGDRILVKIQTVEEKSAGGILLPTTAQSKPQGGEVVAVGQGKTVGDKTLEPPVKPGAQVIYSKYAGTEVDFNGEPHLLLKEDDIVGSLSTDDIKDLQPANDRVLIQIIEMESKSAGGVLLTDSAKEKPVIGTVVATGPGAYGEDGNLKPLEITKGNRVLYSKYAGNDFKSKDGTQFVVLRVSDVLAVLA